MRGIRGKLLEGWGSEQPTEQCTHTKTDSSALDGRGRPQSAPQRPKAVDLEGQGRTPAPATGAGGDEVEEEPGIWEGEESLDLAPPLAGTGTGGTGTGGAAAVAAQKAVETPKIFSNYSDDGEGMPEFPEQEPAAYRSVDEETEVADPIAHGQRIWQTSFRELRERRESTDSFGQVSVSGGDLENQEVEEDDVRVAGDSGADRHINTIYRDYDDDNEYQAPPRRKSSPGLAKPPVIQAASRDMGDSKLPTQVLFRNAPSQAESLNAGNPEKMDVDELRRLVRDYRTYISQNFPKQVRSGLLITYQERRGNGPLTFSHYDPACQVERQVLAELNNHETVAYIKSLQQDVTRYQAQMREQQVKEKALRASHDSLQRLIKQMRRGKGKGAGLPVPGVRVHPDLRASQRLSDRPVSAKVRAL